MQTFTSKFSLKDFIAYLFPGLTWLLAIVVIVAVSEPALSNMVNLSKKNGFIAMVILFSIPLAYLLGAVCSSIGAIVENILMRNRELLKEVFSRDGGAVNEEFLTNLKDTVKKEMDDKYFNKISELSGDKYFYLARTLVGEFLPHAIETAERQDSLRQMRRNSFVPVFFLWVAGVTWGIGGEKLLTRQGQMILLAVSFFWGPFVLWFLWQGIIRNLTRQTRNIFFGLLALPTVLMLKKK